MAMASPLVHHLPAAERRSAPERSPAKLAVAGLDATIQPPNDQHDEQNGHAQSCAKRKPAREVGHDGAAAGFRVEACRRVGCDIRRAA